jgi:hypothetical protein
MTLFSDAIEYYGANDDHEMCIDLNMRMQSILVRPYILDCLCEHNQLSKNETKGFRERLASEDYQTNFESDQRRTTNPYKYIEGKEEEQKVETITPTKGPSSALQKLESKEKEMNVGIIS